MLIIVAVIVFIFITYYVWNNGETNSYKINIKTPFAYLHKFNVFSQEQCNSIINEIKTNPNIKWTSYGNLGANNDLDVGELSKEISLIVKNIISNIVLQKASDAYAIPYANLELLSRSPFIIKYDTAKPSLALHKDNADISFVILLSDENSFDDGGTYFNALDKTLMLKQGQCLLFPGQLVHSARPIKKGERYVVSGFINISDSYKNDIRFRQLQTHWLPI